MAKQYNYDRFIPDRSSSNLYHNFHFPTNTSGGCSALYQMLLKSRVLGKRNSQGILKLAELLKTEQVLSFCAEPHESLDVSNIPFPNHASERSINTKCTRLLMKTPKLKNDFYLNVMDFGANGILSLGLCEVIKLYDNNKNTIATIASLQDGVVTSTKWLDQDHLVVGQGNGACYYYDINKLTVRFIDQTRCRIPVIATHSNLIAYPIQRSRILVRDQRCFKTGESSVTSSYHKNEICGLTFNPNNPTLLASGGNDNMACVWDLRKLQAPVFHYSKHAACVKALAWSPHNSNLLATGSGTADKCIRIWDLQASEPFQIINTRSQVCNLYWSKQYDELISSHGYDDYDLQIWRYNKKTATLSGPVVRMPGHTSRVMYLTVNPKDETVVSGSSDETIRFWKPFEKSMSSNTSNPFKFIAMPEIR